MADAMEVGILRWRVEMLEAALEQIASPLLEADIDEIREEARVALRLSRGAARNNAKRHQGGQKDG